MNRRFVRPPSSAHAPRFLPLLAATVFATTIAFTFSSYMLAELQGLLGLTRHDAMELDLLLLSPLVSLPVLLLVLKQSGCSVSGAKATAALFVGHFVAYGLRSYMDDLVSGPAFPSADERTLIIAYGYLGWVVGPLVTRTTALLLGASRIEPLSERPHVRALSHEPSSDPNISKPL